jgi:hypothetical protein
MHMMASLVLKTANPSCVPMNKKHKRKKTICKALTGAIEKQINNE